MTQKEMDKDMRNHDEHKQLTIRQPGRSFLATRHRACRPDHSTSEPGPEKSLSHNLFTVFRQVPAHCSGESMRQQTRVSPPLFAGFCSPSPSRRWLPNLKGLLVFFAIFGMLSTRAVSAQEPADSVPVLTLEQAVQLALTNNRSVRIASLEVDKSKWQIAEVKTKRLPSFSADIIGSQLLNEISYTFPEGAFGIYPGIGPIPSTDTKVTTPRQPVAFITSQASQPISQLYKIHLGIRSQEVSSQLNSEKLRATRQSVVKDVKQAYYAVLQSESALDAADASVKQYQELDRVVLQRVSQEAALKSDSLDVKAKLADEQYKLVQLRDTLDSRKEYLNDLLGRDIRTEFRTEQVPPASFEEVDLRFAQDRALAQRSEIKQAQLNVQQSEYARRLAKADYIPDFGVAFNYVSTFNVDVLPRNVTSLGFELKWEPWEWGRRRDVVNQKKIVETQAQTQLRDVQSKVLVDVNSRYRKLNESRMLIAVTQATRDAALQRLREVRYRYEQQAVLLRDVLQQQSAVASAHDNYQQALLGFWTAKTDFEKSLGEDQ
jgi:outer membrane protein TolC